MAKTIFFSVGEPSGDLHGANLIRALAARSPEPIRCVGYGGPRMQGAGADLLFDLTQLAVMGFLQVFWKLPKFLRLAARAGEYFEAHRPDAVVLIDFPGFNWHIARLAKRHGVPVFYYGTPQVWGWAPWRVRRLRENVDHALCKLPFEEPWLRERGVNATYVGHPYFDELAARQLDQEFVTAQRDAPGPLVTLLPGSRSQEVQANAADLLRAAQKVRSRVPNARVAVAAFKSAHADRIQRLIDAARSDGAQEPTVHVGKTPELIEAATCCLAVSGSVSLELLHHQKPSAIVYRVSRGMHWVQGFFRKVRYITLVNLLTAPDPFADGVGVYDPTDPRDAHVLMPEYLTYRDRSDALAAHAVEWLTDPAARNALVVKLGELRERVDVPGASERTASYVLDALSSSEATVERAA